MKICGSLEEKPRWVSSLKKTTKQMQFIGIFFSVSVWRTAYFSGQPNAHNFAQVISPVVFSLVESITGDNREQQGEFVLFLLWRKGDR